MGHVAESSQSRQAIGTLEDEAKARRISNRRRLRQVINIDDFEAAAADILPPKYMACKYVPWFLEMLTNMRHDSLQVRC